MTLSFKGIEVFYTRRGKGKTLLLLHGFLENQHMWNELTPSLSETHTVISIDLLGHGQTECYGYIHTMEDMAEFVHAVLEHENIQEWVAIGHSMGGYVALALAEQNPDKTKGIILVNSTASADSEERKINRTRAILAVKQNYKNFVGIAISNLFRPKNRTIFADKIQEIRAQALQTPLQGIIAALEGMKIRKDRINFLKSTYITKLYIIGKNDLVIDYEMIKSETSIVKAKKHEFEDGHMSHIENRNELLTQIVHFIEYI